MRRGNARVIGSSATRTGTSWKARMRRGRSRAGGWRLADGGVLEGPYEAGKRHGHWVERDKDGYVSEGAYVDSLRHGWWFVRNKGVVVEEAYFVKGEGQN